MKPSNSFFGLWATCLLMLGLLCAPLPAVADEGEYQILQARYGTASRNEDVTKRLKELARRDRSFTASNEIFRMDPAPEQLKVLRIFAKGRDGRVRTFEYAENAVVDGSVFTGWGSGNWGSGNSYKGGWNGGGGSAAGDSGTYMILGARYGTYSRNEDVTARLKELARSDRSFRASNRTLRMDPAPEQVKVLRIFAKGPDGDLRTFEYAENAVVDGAMFTGWSGGNWGRGHNGGWGEDRRPGSEGSGTGDKRGSGRLDIVHAVYGADGRERDVTQRLRGRVASDRIDVRVDNELAGTDPAPETPKSLWVTYTLGGGKEQRVRINENDRLRLP
jgi:hypothetical protein